MGRLRISNAAKLNPHISKFESLTDTQLVEQWKGAELNLPIADSQVTWGKTQNLKRGDFVRVTRRIGISREDLLEFLNTKTATSLFLYAFNYDLPKVNGLFGLLGLDLGSRLRMNIAYGGMAVSTTYRKDGWGKMPWGVNLTNGHRIKSLSGDKDYLILLEFDIPVEAIVVVDMEYGLPKHVQENPSGYAIVQPYAPEAEITVIDAVPKEWLRNFDELDRRFKKFDRH